jgi:hypothetical protein
MEKEKIVTLMFCSNCFHHDVIDEDKFFQIATALGYECKVCHRFTFISDDFRRRLVKVYQDLSRDHHS